MIPRIALLVAIGSFMWAARSFRPDVDGGDGAGLTLSLGFVLLAAFLSGQVVSRLGLPKLTGYILAGLAAGPYAMALVTEAMVDGLQLVNGTAIALIALTAGGELNFRRMQPLMRTIGAITFVAVVGTAFLLTAVVLALTPWLPFLGDLGTSGAAAAALVLAVTITAQSPAVVIAIRSEMSADGPITRTVLGVVVVADLVVIVLFALASALCRAVLQGSADLGATVTSVAWELFGSMGAGVVVGLLLALYLSKVRGGASLFLVVVAIAVAEVAVRVHLDPLITMLTAGMLVENASNKGHRLLEEIKAASLPLYVVFFAVAGASIHLDVLPAVFLPAVVLVSSRAIFFLWGTRLAARIAGAPLEVGRYAGYGLLPQAGLAIALSLLFGNTFPEFGANAAALTLGVVAINEMVAPIFFRRALVRSGEAGAYSPETVSAPENELAETRIRRAIERAPILDFSRRADVDEVLLQASETLAERLNIKPEELHRDFGEHVRKGGALTPEIAIPHLRVAGEDVFELMLCRAREGIAFGPGSDHPEALFILVSSNDLRNLHLEFLALVARIAQSEGFLQAWLAPRSEEALRAWLLKALTVTPDLASPE